MLYTFTHWLLWKWLFLFLFLSFHVTEKWAEEEEGKKAILAELLLVSWTPGIQYPSPSYHILLYTRWKGSGDGTVVV